MTSRKLIESYGRRFTPFAQIIGFIAILIVGILIAFKGGDTERGSRTTCHVEQVSE